MLVFGAGVVGQVYAARLADTHEVTIAARGLTYDSLRRHGVRLLHRGTRSVPAVAVADAASVRERFDAVLLAVRADQLDEALTAVQAVEATTVVTLVNTVAATAEVSRRVGANRLVLGFPGVGGVHREDGIEYHVIARQPTTIQRCGGRESGIVDALRAARFVVSTVDDMPGWLATHTVFIVGVGSAILAAGGDCDRLAGDRAQVEAMITAVRDSFGVLQERGVTIQPPALKTIFTRVPRALAVPYWAHLLRGDTGRLAIAPHAVATRDTEFAYLVDQVTTTLLAGAVPASLTQLLATAGYPVDR